MDDIDKLGDTELCPTIHADMVVSVWMIWWVMAVKTPKGGMKQDELADLSCDLGPLSLADRRRLALQEMEELELEATAA